jgi:hypothetical protein
VLANRPYAGIGSRETPPGALQFIEQLAGALALRGYTLRSGAAQGADAAWERGAVAAGGHCEIFLPWGGFQGHRTGLVMERQDGAARAMELAGAAHPAWERLNPTVRNLMARNVMQVLGADCASPAKFVICWARSPTFDAAGNLVNVAGGTGLAVRIAARFNIPAFNLAHPPHAERLEKLLTA